MKAGGLPEDVLLCFLRGCQAHVPRNVRQRQRQVCLREALRVPHLARCQRLLQQACIAILRRRPHNFIGRLCMTMCLT